MAKLNLAGTQITLSVLACIATMLEQDGCIEVVNAYQGALGCGALHLGTIMDKVMAELKTESN